MTRLPAWASILALTAFVPVLVLPFLAGGVSVSEAARKVLVLCDILLLSLSAGLWLQRGARSGSEPCVPLS